MSLHVAGSRKGIQLKFYVYEHWRPDLDVCFYVGKGCGPRAYRLQRNRIYDAVVEDLKSAGMCVEVRMVASGLSEAAAFKIEVERIAFWRGVGIELSNRTDGGEGWSGFVRPLGIRLSEQAKRKVSEARKGMKFSDEHREKLAQRKIGIKRPPFTPETIAKMRAAAQRREEARREKFGSQVRRTSRVKEYS
jgi:hypothetical protein